MLERRTRPSRGEIDEAALALLARHGGQILATARRYAANHEDAEDAYQRALEILLTKAPTTREEELVPWLKTVVKHEAFALRRQRDRLTPVTGDGEAVERGTAPAATHDQAERYERLSQSAEALRRLKPQEIRCLVLRAQGLSYREICRVTGFTYTKVNRCLTEGRQALATRLAGIEGGVECSRLAPLLSALADGEADAEALTSLRPHLKTCLSCRARLREFRAAPARVAALVPAGLLAADGTGLRAWLDSAVGAVQQKAEALLAAAHHKTVAISERAQTAAEIVTGQKVAALAASAAALAGGGAAVDQLANQHGPSTPVPRHHAAVRPSKPEAAKPPPAAPVTPTPEQKTAAEEGSSAPPIPKPQPAPPDPANEFAPANASTAAAPAGGAGGTPEPGPPQRAPDPVSPAPGAGGGEFSP